MTLDDCPCARTTTSTLQKGKSDAPADYSELRVSSWANRFTGVPHDRASSVARALERAERCYTDDTSRSVAVFDSVIQRAMMSDDCITSARSNKVGSKATITTAQSFHSPASKSVRSHLSTDDIGTSNLSDLMEVLANSTSNCISNQREEITCLRLAVKELIVELTQQQPQHQSRGRVPNVIEIQDRSAVDEDSVKGMSVGFQSRDEIGTPSRMRERNLHLISTGTGQSKCTSTSTSRNPCNHNDPEGLYIPHERARWGKKLDPPSSHPMSSLNENGKLHDPLFQVDSPDQDRISIRDSSSFGSHDHSSDKNTSLEDSLHDKLNEVRRRILASPPQRDDPKINLDPSGMETSPLKEKTHGAYYCASSTTFSRGDAHNMRSTFQRTPPIHKAPISPAMERARELVIERRQRFRNFHIAHEMYAKQHRQPKTPLSQLLPQTPPSKEGFLASPNGDDQQEPLSPLVCLREDELTLMETTAKGQTDRRKNPYPS